MEETRREDTRCIRKESCPECGSRDNLARYDDGHAHCFTPGCKYWEPAEGVDREGPKVERAAAGIPAGDYRAIPSRRISEETCRKWGYQCGMYRGRVCQIARFQDERGAVVAAKLRYEDKDFEAVGDLRKAMPLYGQWLWSGKGRMVIVTEGEIDALSVSEFQNNRWPVVSVPNGAQGAKRSVARASEWLEGFDSIVFMFDADEAGRFAAAECAEQVRPGRAKIAQLPDGEDPNSMMVAGRGKEVMQAAWGARVYRPDGIVEGSELWERVVEYRRRMEEGCTELPWPTISAPIRGIRRKEITMITSGSGCGKTTFCDALALAWLESGEHVGYIGLEEPVERTVEKLVGMKVGRRLHMENVDYGEDEKVKEAFDQTVGNGNLYLYDHFGSLDGTNLAARIRYLIRACDCAWIILDHISIVVSGTDTDDERRLIDNLMTKLVSITQEFDVGIVVVVHLKRPKDGRSFNEGRPVALSDLRGSGALEQLSMTVLALERNQQDEEKKNVITVRSLKCRWTGYTGKLGQLVYNDITGRLEETRHDFVENETPADVAKGGFY